MPQTDVRGNDNGWPGASEAQIVQIPPLAPPRVQSAENRLFAVAQVQQESPEVQQPDCPVTVQVRGAVIGVLAVTEVL